MKSPHAYAALLMAPLVSSYTPPTPNATAAVSGDSRRAFLRRVATTSGAATTIASIFSSPASVSADADAATSNSAPLTDVYFGVGCFWHIQHEFVEAERRLLNRSDSQLTSRTGFAGGTKTDGEGRVCYHNFQGVGDYGKLGHGEVVGMSIPEASIGDFATEYFSLFSPKGERVDPMDRGGEYRSLLGLPGGMSHPLYPQVEAAAEAKGMILALGKGNDPDTLGKKLIYVMDSTKYPFYQAEVYHQFHNDFQSPAYGKKYNNLVINAYEDGRVKDTGCPDRIPV